MRHSHSLVLVILTGLFTLFPESARAENLRVEIYLAREANLSWDCVPAGLTAQRMERASGPVFEFETIATLPLSARSYKDNDGGKRLEPGHTYAYRIAWDVGGGVQYSGTTMLDVPAEIVADGWRVLPIRFKSEYDAGMLGGEAEQHLHSMDRCLTRPNVIYINQDVCGVWRSVDSGETWQKTLDKGLYLNKGQSMAVDPLDPNCLLIEVDNTFNYKAPDDEGIYRSVDGGNSWTRVLATATNYNASVGRSFRKAIAYDPTSLASGRAQRWYVALPNNGIYRSEDGGESFPTTYESSLAGHQVVFQVCPDPRDGQTVWLGTDQGLWVSRARGANLQAAGDLPAGRVTSVAIDPRDPSRIFAVVEDVGLYRSTNGGVSFALLKSFPARRMFQNPGYPDTMYLVGATYTIVTHNGGQSWYESAVSIAHPEVGDIRTGNAMEIDGGLAGIAPNPENPTEAVCYSKASIWKTTDGGRSYYDSSALFTGYAWSWWNRGAAFDRFDPKRWAFFNNDVGMTLTTTGGDWFVNNNPQAWDWYQSGLIEWIGSYAGDFQPSPSSTRMVSAVGQYFRTQLMITSNLGQSWGLLANPSDLESTLDMHLFVAFHPEDPSFVYAGDKVSTNAGSSFTHIDFGAFAADEPYIVGMCENHPDTVYAITKNRATLIRSDDRGANWRHYATPGWRFGPFDSLPTFAAHPSDPNVVFTLSADGDMARFDGSSWTNLGVLAALKAANPHEADYNYVRTMTVDPNNGDILYAGMFASGIDCAWRSLDGGRNWENISENLPRIGLSAMAVNPHTGELFIGSGIGTWIYPSPYSMGEPVYAKAHPRPIGQKEPSGGYQAWRLERFGLEDFLDPTVSGRDADPDGDGRTNFFEYAFGYEPLTADSTVTGPVQIVSAEGNLQIEIRQRRGAPKAHLQYDLLESTDLFNWQIVDPAGYHASFEETDPDGVEIWVLRVNVDLLMQAPRFYALSARELGN